METKDRITRDLTISKEEDCFVSNYKREYDYKDQGYFTESTQVMKIYDKEFVETQVETLKKEIERVEKDIVQNDEFLSQLDEFLKDTTEKHGKVLDFFEIETKYKGYLDQQTEFKASLESNQMFLAHYQEMLEMWNNESN